MHKIRGPNDDTQDKDVNDPALDLIIAENERNQALAEATFSICYLMCLIFWCIAAYYFYTYSNLSGKNPDVWVKDGPLYCWANTTQPTTQAPYSDF